ncbi:MAG: N-acyl-D-amino-acid deacylase [Firmicutes bacterium]|nr:N-acyl-D-amino-acid deacylase [Bacillota bacterium]
MENMLIRNATVVDGTGRPGFVADVVVTGQYIAEIGTRTPFSDVFTKIIDADGLTLSPGFIDMHSHSDLMQMVKPEASAKISQGITTELFGQDGLGVAPVLPSGVSEYRQHVAGLLGDPDIPWEWPRLSDYLGALEDAGTATNIATLISHGSLRHAVLGMEERSARANEIAEMCNLAEQAYTDGAFGFSTGLIYPPCVFADHKELTELAKVTTAAGGIYVVHVRNERGEVKESIQEIFSIARETGVAPHISHLKVIGKENWGTASSILTLFDKAKRENLNVAFDQYPYPAGSTMLSILIPPYAHAGGPDALLTRLRDPEMRQRFAQEMEAGIEGWENIASAAGWDRVLITGIETGVNKKWEGHSLAEIAMAKNITPQEVVFELLIDEKLQVSMVNFSISEEDVALIIKHPCGMLGTDGLLLGKPHPRAFGSTARILQKYVRDEQVLTLEEAISRMTWRPAKRLGLSDRGVIKAGAIADINLFDFSQIAERGTYSDPCKSPAGFEYVFVNGMAALDQGVETGALSGQVLRKKSA